MASSCGFKSLLVHDIIKKTFFQKSFLFFQKRRGYSQKLHSLSFAFLVCRKPRDLHTKKATLAYVDFCSCLNYLNIPEKDFALSSVSLYSASSFESVTIPPPT